MTWSGRRSVGPGGLRMTKCLNVPYMLLHLPIYMSTHNMLWNMAPSTRMWFALGSTKSAKSILAPKTS